MHTTTRSDKSLPMSLLQTLIKPIGQKLITPKKAFPAGSAKLTPHKGARKKCQITERQVEGLWVYDLTSKASANQNQNRTPGTGTEKGDAEDRRNRDGKTRRIYYFAGGAWQMPPSPEHWKFCAELSTKIPHSVISVVSYPLAPNSPADAAFPALEKFYAAIMSTTLSTFPSGQAGGDVDGEKTSRSAEENEIITFAGDSAGGNIALALTVHMLTTYPQLRAPASLLLVSPVVDLRPQDARDSSLRETQKHDPLLSLPYTNSAAEAWVGEMDPSDPRLTPLNADISALASRGVKVFGITGGYDVLTPPALEFKEKCNEKGVEGEWLHWEGQMHCFPLAWVYGLKESREGKNWILDVLSR
ncbi:alpha/beta hydrolase fold-domain-containing protein [Delphinella strobiligena]|nr:alpha/beta hydrolase fold-domain-containing protein [Delphinella strobiligena]